MGGQSSSLGQSQSPGKKDPIGNAIRDGKSINHLSTIPTTDLLENLGKASKLVGEYSKNDIKELMNYIESNDKEVIDPTLKDKILGYYKKFENYTSKSTNGQTLQANMKENMKYENFYKFLKQNETSDLLEKKEAILKSPLLASNTEEQKTVTTIFDNIAIMKAKEQYYKYEYILTQIWIMSYLKNMNTAVTEFTEKTLTLVKDNEEFRNRYAKEMLQEIVNILVQSEGDLKDGDFDFFRKQLINFQTNIEKTRDELEVKVKENEQQLTAALNPDEQRKAAAFSIEREARDKALIEQGRKEVLAKTQQNSLLRDKQTLQNADKARSILGTTAQPQRPGFGGKSKKQNGGFVRDHSSFPQAFYELNN